MSETELRQLSQKWKKEDEELWNKIQFCDEHCFKLESMKYREIREVKRRMIFELDSVVGNTK